MEIFAAMEKMPLFHGLDREQIQELFGTAVPSGGPIPGERWCCGPGSGPAVWDCCSPEAYMSFGRISGAEGPLWAL